MCIGDCILQGCFVVNKGVLIQLGIVATPVACALPHIQPMHTLAQAAAGLLPAGSSGYDSGGGSAGSATQRFVEERLRPVFRRASEAVAERTVREVFQSSRSYVTGLWARLNGQAVDLSGKLPLGMRTPAARSGMPCARSALRMAGVLVALQLCAQPTGPQSKRCQHEMPASLCSGSAVGMTQHAMHASIV